MTLKRTETIKHLEREKWLTAMQLSKLFKSGYSGTTRLLNRMVDDKLIGVHKVGQNDPLYFFLPQTKAPTVFKHTHERSCADIYVAYENTDLVQRWTVPENLDDYQEYVKVGLLPDRVSVIAGKIVFWEIDLGTESYKTISDKIPLYISLGKRHPEHRFHVVFTTKDYYRFKNGRKVLRQSAKARAKRILLDLMEYKRGNQFIVGQHDSIVNDPLGAVFASPLTPDRLISLNDLM